MLFLWSLEPIAKLVSGDRLPHFGPFPGLNFAPWNHHAAYSIPKMDSKWDCRSSTQSFAIGSLFAGFQAQMAPEFLTGLLNIARIEQHQITQVIVTFHVQFREFHANAIFVGTGDFASGFDA